MRKLLGIVLLAAGVGGLGYWGAKDHALDMQSEISVRAVAAVSGAVHGVQTQVEGRDIRLSGLADSDAEAEALVQSLNAVEGRRVVINELEVLPNADPYTIAATRKSGQTRLQGNVPSEDMRAVLAQSGASGVDELTLASGAPERWEAAIGAGLGALSQMDEGSVSLNGTNLRLTGLVDAPSDRDTLIASVKLPEGFTLQNDIETRDDGLPISYDVVYDAAKGVSVSGKLPVGLDLEQIGAAIGIADVSGEPSTGLNGDPKAGLEALGKLKAWLPEFDTATLKIDGDTPALSGEASPGVNSALVQESMAAEFGEGVALTFSNASGSVQNGAERVNASTGLTESFQFGFWLPKTNFTPSLSNCAEQSDKVLEQTKINFLSGSTDLGPRSQRAINALAAIMGPCVNTARLTVELGGHTDDTGSGNYELSAARALVVGEAMIARGVPREAISAVGYGPSKPIADNATEAGRAANRRTTVRWAQQ